MQERLNSKINEYIADMPSLPTSVAKVLEICNDPRISPADLNHVISLDPVLVGRVLKLINSAYYGPGQQVTNMVKAIIMLGINTVKNLALSTAILRNLAVNRDIQGLNMEGFWRHSLCVGVAAKLIARRRGVDPKQLEEYFTAGLLHDIGKIPINAVLSRDYMSIISAADNERVSMFRVEDEKLGMNHCTAGAAIVRAWKLSGPVGAAIVNHHSYNEYSGSYQDILYSVAAANRFAVTMEIGFAGDRYPETDNQVWDSLGINEGMLNGIEKNVNEEIEKAKVFLRL